MKDPGEPHELSRKRNAAPEASSSGVRLECTEGARSYSKGYAVGYHLRCTATKDKPCHLIHHLTEWNTLLFPARFELQELPGARGRLSLVSFFNSSFHLTDLPEAESSQSRRAVHSLLTTHRCIVSLHVVPVMPGICEKLLCDALRRNSSLRILAVGFSAVATQTDLAAVIQCLTSLEELECTVRTERPTKVVAALCTLLRTSSSLTHFRMFSLCLEEQDSKAITAALLGNSTLKQLSIVGSPVEEPHEGEFTNYLRFTTTLTSLRMAASNVQTQNSLLQGVVQNQTLSTLTLERFICNEESARLVARIFRKNVALLAFHIMSTEGSPRPHRHCGQDWIEALAENNALQELTLPLSIWSPDMWENLFRMLSANSNLKKMVIQVDCADFTFLSSVCRALAESGAEENVSCGTYFVVNNADLINCRVFSGILIYRVAGETVALEALRQLPLCDHVTSLAIDVSGGNIARSSALAEYVTSAAHLVKLHLRLALFPDMVENLPNESWTLIARSLSKSSSLKELVILTNSLETEDASVLADSVTNSQCIRTFRLYDYIGPNTSAFVTRLSTGIAGNYTLRDIKLRGRLDAAATRSWFSVSETTRRNSSILARAVEFTQGRHLGRCFAAALERVSLHTPLIEDLAEFCETTKEATAVSVRARVRSFEPMDAFMRLAGVVKERVVCYPRDDGVTQLDQLNEHCWTHVRRYLMLEDIEDNAIQNAETRGRLQSSISHVL